MTTYEREANENLLALVDRTHCPCCGMRFTDTEIREFAISGRPCELCVDEALTEEADRQSFAEWCDQQDDQAYEAGRYIVTATGGR